MKTGAFTDTVGNHVAPVSDEYNEWVQLGEYGGGQTCQRLNPRYGPPSWGVYPSICSNSVQEMECPQSISIFCCNRTEDDFAPASLIKIKVFSSSFNGTVFNRYVRVGKDNLTSGEKLIWSDSIATSQDISLFGLNSNYTENFTQVVYFCFKQTTPAFGLNSTLYKMSNTTCSNGWRLQYYLYAASQKSSQTEAIYVGVSNKRPHHSRVTYNGFLHNYNLSLSFVIYGYSEKTISNSSSPKPTRNNICTRRPPVILKAPIIITSPNYPNKYNDSLVCEWIVTLSESDRRRNDTKLKLSVIEMSIEIAPFCLNDWLNIDTINYDLTTTTVSHREHVDKRCGTHLGNDVITSKSLFVAFHSDSVYAQRGFRLQVEVISDSCGGVITDDGKDITSPGYPAAYVGGLNCTWTIQAPNSNYNVEIQFDNLQLVSSKGCFKDFVKVESPGLRNSSVYCGSHRGLRLILRSNLASVRLITQRRDNNQPTGKGISAYVYFVPRSKSRTCGIPDVAPWGEGGPAESKIIGGSEAVVGSWPWVVRIDGASCGGVLVSNRWVLTAAHCVIDSAEANYRNYNHFFPNMNHITAVMGRHVANAPSTATEQTSKIVKAYVYPGYKYRNPRSARTSFGHDRVPFNDLALLLLATPTRDSATVKPICLPTQDAKAGETCVIAGWGSRKALSFIPLKRNALHFARVPILNNSLCNSWPALAGAVLDNNICAGFVNGRIDSCKGDSGGPLMCKGVNGAYQVHGIISWGKQCGVAQQPGVYTRVWSFYEWINNKISKTN